MNVATHFLINFYFIFDRAFPGIKTMFFKKQTFFFILLISEATDS